jgi:hypothetical protein
MPFAVAIHSKVDNPHVNAQNIDGRHLRWRWNL